MNIDILNLLDSSDIIPSSPETVTRLVDLTNNPNYKLADITKLLSADPGVVTDIIRLANSALFGAGSKAKTLNDAIIRLGIRRIRTLILGRSMIAQLNKTRSPIIDTSYFWRRSLATGVLASRFAERLSSIDREHAFLGGLLCDIGINILARALPEEYIQFARAYAPLTAESSVAAELESIGVTHPEVSALALERWNFPETVVSAVRYHHDDAPPNAREASGLLARVINGSGRIARLLCESAADKHIRVVCAKAMDVAGLPLEVLPEILELVEADVTEMAVGLRIEVISSKVYQRIAQLLVTELAVIQHGNN